MPGATYPPTLPAVIASEAGGGFITNPMPDAVTGTNAASIVGGFPPITMQNELAGGEPPDGQDFNGYLFLLSSHTMYLQCGQLYQYNSTLAGDIGGYLAGTILGMTDGTGAWLCTENGNTSNPDTGGAGWVPIYAYGVANVTGLVGGTVNLTAAEAKYPIIVLSGTLGANLTLNFPETTQEWLIINKTTGAFTTTAQTAAGGSVGITVPQGGNSAPTGIYSVGDGNIYPTVAPLSVPISQAATPLTLVERDNNGYVFATYFNQSSGLEAPSIGAVFVQNSAADGYLRKVTLATLAAQMALSSFAGQVTAAQVPSSAVTQFTALILASAALTGTPTAPTPSPGTSNTQIATTAFVNQGQNVVGNGYVKFSSGLIIQWGTYNYPGSGGASTNFPIAFTSALFGVVTCSTVGGYSLGFNAGASNLSTVVFGTNGLGGTNQNFFWIALGK